MDLLNHMHAAPTMIAPNGWLMLGAFQSACYNHSVVPTIESFLFFHQVVMSASGGWVYLQARGRGSDCVRFVDDLADSLKN